MRFGINVRNRLTGADLYVRIFQLTGLAPVLYVLVACVHPAVFTSENVFSVLFRLGMSALPRWEALGLSRLYRMSHSEVLVCAAVLVFALIFVIMYFLILKPQQKKLKDHQELVKNIRRGDTVVTNGGLVGKVTKVVDDDQIEVEIADGVRIRQMRQMISGVRTKGEPAKDSKEETAAS